MKRSNNKTLIKRHPILMGHLVPYDFDRNQFNSIVDRGEHIINVDIFSICYFNNETKTVKAKNSIIITQSFCTHQRRCV